MHRDIVRLLALLAVVRVVTTVACPAPAPLPRPAHTGADDKLRHHVRVRKPVFPRDTRYPSSSASRDRNSTLDQTTDSQRPPTFKFSRASRTTASVPTVTNSPTAGEPPAPPQGQRGVLPPPVPSPLTDQPCPPPDRPPSAGRPPAPARSGGRRPQRRGARGRRGRGTRRAGAAALQPDRLANTGLLIGALNIQSLKPKLLELTDVINTYDFDVLLLSETWLRPSTPSCRHG